jgi:ABC-type Mn2+/Zn2+ transport system permease subunit
VLLALTIVASFEVVGNLLVFAFLVAPPAAATMLVRRVPWIMVTALGLGSVSVVLGLLVSYHRSTAAGATMALASVLLFVVVLALSSVRRNLRADSKAG